MKQEWLTCCNWQMDDKCDGDNGAGCVAMKRVKFILQHYSSWMRYKSMIDIEDSDCDDSSDDSSSDGGGSDVNESNKLILRAYPWITDFIAELGGYSYVSLSDDFEHIRDFHMKLNKNKTSDTIEYFDSSLGKCADKECSCLARHCRDRHIDNMNEKKRREIFFIKEDEEKGMNKVSKNRKHKKLKKQQNANKENKMFSEINLQTKLD
eukprot:462668_1